MASLNQCNLIGNVGRDPEVRYFGNGEAVVNLSLACSETWKDKATGEKKEKTEWVPIVFIGNLAETAGKYLKKGSQIHVTGKFTTRKWQDKEGVDRYTSEIRVFELVMLGKAPGQQDQQGGGQPATTSQRPASAPAAQQRPAQRAPVDDGDDIPF